MRRGLFLASTALGVAVSTVAAMAQSPATGEDEILVTAQKREQRLQDVPISISVVGADEIEDSGLQGVMDLGTLVPSFVAAVSNPPGASASFRIRGVGTSGQNAGLEGAVGFFLDGVYRPRAGTALSDLIDIERIEVLRGPQGTLFGKNTSAGAVSVVTRNPSLSAPSGQLQTDIGERNLFRVRAAVDLPLVEDRFGIRLSAGVNTEDGWLRDISSGEDYNNKDRWNFRGQAFWQASPDLSLRLIADRSEFDEACCQAVRLFAGPTAGLINTLAGNLGLRTVNPARPNDLVTSANLVPKTDVADSGVSLEVNWDVGGMTLTSISSYRDWQEKQFNDIDFTAADIINRPDTTFDVASLTQELRLAGTLERGPFGHGGNWLFGGFYSDEEIARQNDFFWGTQAATYFNTLLGLPLSLHPAGPASLETFRQESSSWAVFAHGDVGLTERLSVTGGLRYTDEEKSGSGRFALPFPGALGRVNPFTTSLNEGEYSGTLTGQYRFSPDVMGFATYARGYKAGGINLDRAAAGTPTTGPLDPRFGPEFSTNYEVGLKSRFWDHRGTLNLSVFDTKFEDFQLNAFDGIRFTITNVSGARTRGVEMDANIRPVEPLFFSLAVTYLDARYDDDVGPGGAGLPRLGGQRLVFAPEWQGTFVTAVDQPLTPAISIFGRGEYAYRGAHSTSSSNIPQLRQQGYGLLGLRAGLKASNEHWEAAAFCRNCTNEVTVATGFAAVVQAGSFDAFVNPPREAGVAITFRFNE